MAQSKTSKPAPRSDAEHDGESPEKQDRSIKARKSSLFESHEHNIGETRPFSEYLKSVPPAPLPTMAKASLIALGVVVMLLLLAAVMTAGRSRTKRGQHSDFRPDGGRSSLASCGQTYNSHQGTIS